MPFVCKQISTSKPRIKELNFLVNIKSYSRRGNVQTIFKEGVKTGNVIVERHNNMVSVPRELMQYSRL